VKIGDVLKIHKNEAIPADMLVIKTSLGSGFCYMETTNLDGESALKPREQLPILKNYVKQIKHNNSSNRKGVEEKKLLNIKLENKNEEAIKQITYLTQENYKDIDKGKDKHPQKLKNEYDYPYYPKNIPLPAEKNFNINIDFNQFDQFSPPSNQNLITKNINNIYEYNCTFNKSNYHSSKYGAVDYNYKKRKQELENYQKKNHILHQEYKADNFTRRNNQDQREKDKSKDKDKEKLHKNYLISKLMKTTSDKVSLIDQNQNSKWK